TVSQSIKRLKEIEDGFKGAEEAAQQFAAALEAVGGDMNQVDRTGIKDPMSHLTKKERLMRTRERANLNRVLGGIMNMAGLPDLVVVLSVHQDKIAVDEAVKLGIPVIGVVDTNANPEGVTYVIPGNDDSARALSLYTRLMTDAVLSGIQMQANMHAPSIGADVRGGTRAKAQNTVTLSKAAQEAANEDAAAPVAAAETAQAANA
ncbi:MAG: 30S ribosomal protein S2, partial [Alphaproteobacteria bacterium]